MIPTIKVYKDEFTPKMRRLISLSSRGEVEFVNSRMYHSLKRASDNTPIATRGRIQSELGATITRQRFNKKGKVTQAYSYKPTPLVYALINARQKKRGLGGFAGPKMEKEAKTFIARRLRAVGSLRAGWKRAIGIMAATVKQAVFGEGPSVKQPSRATPAVSGRVAHASMEYRIAIKTATEKGVDPRVVKAWEASLAAEEREMDKQLEIKMNSVAKEAGVL